MTAAGLALGYGGARVLAGVDLEAQAGQFWFLLGPNGQGKTTLLRAILGSVRPQAGVLRLHPTLADRTAIGFVPQRCDLNRSLPTTVREFVSLGLVGLRVGGAEARERVGWALAHAGLAGAERRRYWDLSGGQRQRALIARALVRRPRLLILDEPTSNLDFAIEQAILALLDALNREEAMTILFVSHDLHVAARHATHVALFRGGAVRAGPAAELLAPAQLEWVYELAPGAGEGR